MVENFKLSVIIPTWNRKKKIIKLLKILMAELNKKKFIFEIIICDSYSKDGTYKEIKKVFQDNPKILYKNIKDNNISKKRNTGIKNSRYNNVLLLDDDCIPLKNFFKILKSYLNSKIKNSIFCGQYFTQKKLILRSNYYRFRDLKNIKTQKLTRLNFNNIITGCCFFKKNELKNSFFFNEDIKGYGLEDVEWAFRLKKNKFNLYLTESKVDHQETSKNIRAYVIKWYALARYAMPSLLKNSKEDIKGKIFIFEKLFDNRWVRLVVRILNFLTFIPLSIILNFYLSITDQNKFFFSKKLFYILLCLYYLRGACDRNSQKVEDTKWFNLGYK